MLAALVSVVLCAAAWGVLDAQAPFWPEVPLMPVGRMACTPTSPQRLAESADDLLHDGGVLLASNDVVRLAVCTPGTLRFTARGSALGGHGAYLVVSSGAINLWEGEVLEEAVFELPVREPGWLALAFVNDAYAPPEDRNLWISDLTFVPDTGAPEGGP